MDADNKNTSEKTERKLRQQIIANRRIDGEVFVIVTPGGKTEEAVVRVLEQNGISGIVRSPEDPREQQIPEAGGRQTRDRSDSTSEGSGAPSEL